MQDTNLKQNENDPSPSINASGYLIAVAAMIAIFAAGALWGSPDISRAINLCLVVASLALGTKFGFEWVSVAAKRDPESPTVVATRPDAMQAAPLVSRLEEHGIQAVATGTHTSGFQVEIASPVRVVVAKRDSERAMEVLGDEAGG